MISAKDELIKMLRGYSQFGFHLSRKSWITLELSNIAESELSAKQLSDIYTLRRLADRINEKRYKSSQMPEPIHAGKLISLSIINDVFRYIIGYYCQKENPGTIAKAVDWAANQRGHSIVIQPAQSFARLFPPTRVLQGKQPETEFLQKTESDLSQNDSILNELILLYFSCFNPAFKPYKILFDDAELIAESPYIPLMQSLEGFFAKQPPLSVLGMTLFECLYTPIRNCSDSLECQLEYIRIHWGKFLPLDLLEQLYLASDILKEERTLRGLGTGPVDALRFDRYLYGGELGYSEPAAFSQDADWMSNVVLIAKSVYVWLFQLSQKYQRDIRFLSDIPDEELDQLARWGFTGLWLIGVWERSSASRKIKQIMGNPEAAASAYSLYDYVIAEDLGGEESLQNLKWRAWQRGIRIASDMVPNHMGIYSKWVIEHPQWFIQSSFPPFPVYQYTGVDLSEDGRVCIQIEDGYWQHRDAAVVFKRIDKFTGDVRYIYHGNDGTSMPWNDTAQLNFLLPEVREAVIQTILHVARKFPIIRFDAAMTLAKRHYQRLWFPKPGEGGAIPSRAECGMTRTEFDAQFPKEFWREVVDRVTLELPDTLLLAEAFWLMEGYFVRTLGMHRVYNSAFMNMLKMEDNAKYRTTIKNVLEFSPQVLQRFVNFMNNPDERTAVDQFGRGDKYFGVAMMMVTMPGLPMFGHGQIEGFSEKYGMEYRRSYWDEKIDTDMVRRHESQIFPIMRKRYIFSGAVHFALYDFITGSGHVDENVFAYSNKSGNDRGLILYNNAYNTTSGSIRVSTAINIADVENAVLVRRTLAEALELKTDSNCFYIFRDYQSGLEYIRSAGRISAEGLFANLGGYQFHAFLDWREVFDNDGSWRELDNRLQGRGVASIEEAYRELNLEPILNPFRQLMNKAILEEIRDAKTESKNKILAASREFFESIKRLINSDTPIKPLLEKFEVSISDLLEKKLEKTDLTNNKSGAPHCLESSSVHIQYAKLILDTLNDIVAKDEIISSKALLTNQINQWLLPKVIQDAFTGYLKNSHDAYSDSRLVIILIAHANMLNIDDNVRLAESFRQALIDPDIREYLQIHSYNDIQYLNKERLERILEALILTAKQTRKTENDSLKPELDIIRKNALLISESAESAGYQIDKIIELLE
jgi:glycosidase